MKATVEADDSDLERLNAELSDHVPGRQLKRLASAGLRGEVFFPVPYLLERDPFVLGYYRLLFGFSQKAFYEQGPFSKFKALEGKGKLPEQVRPSLPAFCESLIQTAALLLDGIDPVALEIINELQLLTLGPQLRGSRNVDVGQVAVEAVFDFLKGLLARYAPVIKGRNLSFTNDSGIPVLLHFGGDPDVGVTMKLGAEDRKLVAIEIKGGTDVSNIWNRLGEAEKSHQTAKKKGFNELWTVTGVDLDSNPDTRATARQKSPSTTRFFFLPRIGDGLTAEGALFRQLLGSIVGAKLAM